MVMQVSKTLSSSHNKSGSLLLLRCLCGIIEPRQALLNDRFDVLVVVDGVLDAVHQVSVLEREDLEEDAEQLRVPVIRQELAP